MVFYTHTSVAGNTFGTTFTEKMRITHDGSVGIGTVPGANNKIHVYEASNQLLARFETDGLNNVILELTTDGDGTPRDARIGFDYRDDVVGINNGGSLDGVSNGIVINSSGQVGIKIVPNEALTVAGNVRITGDTYWTGAGSGVPYGEVYVNDNTTVTSVSSAGFTQFLHFNSNGHSNLSTPDHTNDHITIVKAGIYMVECCVNIKNSSGAAHTIEAVIAKNNGTTIFPNMRRHRTLGTGADVGAIPICGQLDLAVDDTIEVCLTSDSASARNVTGEDIVLMLTMVGGN